MDTTDTKWLEEILAKVQKIEEITIEINKTHDRLYAICTTALSLDGELGDQLKYDALAAVVLALEPGVKKRKEAAE